MNEQLFIDVLKFLDAQEGHFLTGSQKIGGAGPTSDIDIVVKVADYTSSDTGLTGMGFVLGGSGHGPYDTFASFTRDGVNLILVNSWEYYYAWYEATHTAIEAGAATRDDRVAVFQGVWLKRGLAE